MKISSSLIFLGCIPTSLAKPTKPAKTLQAKAVGKNKTGAPTAAPVIQSFSSTDETSALLGISSTGETDAGAGGKVGGPKQSNAISTCEELYNNNCFDISFETLAGRPDACSLGSLPDETQYYKVCLELTLSGECSSVDSISHICDGADAQGCPYVDGGYDSKDSGSCSAGEYLSGKKCESAPSGVKMCQFGTAGQTLYFSLKNAAKSEPDPKPKTLFPLSLGDCLPTLDCDDAEGAGRTCSGGGNQKTERVFSVSIPSGSCGPCSEICVNQDTTKSSQCVEWDCLLSGNSCVGMDVPQGTPCDKDESVSCDGVCEEKVCDGYGGCGCATMSDCDMMAPAFSLDIKELSDPLPLTLPPTGAPTGEPTATPTALPTALPTAAPTGGPTATPTALPTALPTAAPTGGPTETPTATPTETPTAAPTDIPTTSPTLSPTGKPSSQPTLSQAPSMLPSSEPSSSQAPTCLDQFDPVDICLAIDESGSVCSRDPNAPKLCTNCDCREGYQYLSTGDQYCCTNYDQTLAFSQLFIELANERSANSANIGVTFFSTAATVATELTTPTEAIAALLSDSYSGGFTNTMGAIKRCQSILANGDTNNKKVMVLLTDGNPTATDTKQNDKALGSSEATKAANDAKESGITILSVGVGRKIDVGYLTSLGSKPEFYLSVTDFGALSEVLNQLLSGLLCAA